MRDGLLIAALCFMSALCGGILVYFYQETRVASAQKEALGLRDANEELVAEKQRAISERDKWQHAATAERKEIYRDDQESADWGSALVPVPLSTRVRNSARSTDAAAADLERGDLPSRSSDPD